MTTPWIVCAWYTPDDRHWANKLIVSLDAIGAPHDIVIILHDSASQGVRKITRTQRRLRHVGRGLFEDRRQWPRTCRQVFRKISGNLQDRHRGPCSSSCVPPCDTSEGALVVRTDWVRVCAGRLKAPPRVPIFVGCLVAHRRDWGSIQDFSNRCRRAVFVSWWTRRGRTKNPKPHAFVFNQAERGTKLTKSSMQFLEQENGAR